MNRKQLIGMLREQRPEPPVGFEVRMEARLAGLTERNDSTKKRHKLPIVLAAAVLMLLLAGTALAGYSRMVIRSQVFHGPVFYNEQTGEYEVMAPLPEAEPVGEEYVRVEVSSLEKCSTDTVLLTPSNNSDTDWLIIDGDSDWKIRRLTVECQMALGVSEFAQRGPVYVQADIWKDGEWVFGCKQPLDAGERCQLILPKRSPFRLWLWKPEGNDWVCRYSYTSRWW